MTITFDDTVTLASCSPNSVVAGTTASCTATVIDTSSSPTTPSGTVTFTSNRPHSSFTANPCTLSGGSGSSASCSVTFTAGIAAATVTATYHGDGTHTPSSGHGVVKVTARSTSTTLQCDQPSVAVGQTTTCTVTVFDIAPGTASIPTGKVVFAGNKTDSFTPPSCTLLAGPPRQASCTTSYGPMTGKPGVSHQIPARYAGDSSHTSTTGKTTITIAAGAT